MALFKKKDKTIDLTARYMKQKERMENLRENAKASESQNQGQQTANLPVSGFGFLDNVSSGSYNSQPTTYSGYSSNSYEAEEPDEKKRKLAKRLMDITDKLEEISNQLYHLQQRVELLEKKFGQGY